MHHWDRNTAGKLKRTSAPQEQGCEVSLHSNQMETPPEELMEAGLRKGVWTHLKSHWAL